MLTCNATVTFKEVLSELSRHLKKKKKESLFCFIFETFMLLLWLHIFIDAQYLEICRTVNGQFKKFG